jgi:N-acetylmuramoyl-L-alanine amidase
MIKLAIVVGHNEQAQGAVRAADGVTEFAWNSDLARIMHDLAPADTAVFYRRAGPNEIRDAYRMVDQWGPSRSVELHFNSFTDPSAGGTETLYAESSGAGHHLAVDVQAAMVEALGLRNRGLKPTPRSGRGGASLHAGRAPAVLVEPYFGSNPTECAIADQRKTTLAVAILRGCGIDVPAEPLSAPPTVMTPEPMVLRLAERVASLEARVARLEGNAPVG